MVGYTLCVQCELNYLGDEFVAVSVLGEHFHAFEDLEDVSY